MSDEKLKFSNINIKVGLDEKNIPTLIQWNAEDDPESKKDTEAKAMLLSLFDKEHKDTVKIDIWTKEMQLVEMDRFYYQTLRSLADTYLKATNNLELANQMQQFVQYFGEKTKIIQSEE